MGRTRRAEGGEGLDKCAADETRCGAESTSTDNVRASADTAIYENWTSSVNGVHDRR